MYSNVYGQYSNEHIVLQKHVKERERKRERERERERETDRQTERERDGRERGQRQRIANSHHTFETRYKILQSCIIKKELQTDKEYNLLSTHDLS